ncbi:MAG: hypothetical protein Q8K88_07710, partial [Bradyrhizobium sp.]|nr:hypothetical protein [Bradyrhizobium sp.]
MLAGLRRDAAKPIKFEAIGISAASNHRETGKIRQCATISIVFRRNPVVVCAIKLGLSGVSCALR